MCYVEMTVSSKTEEDMGTFSGAANEDQSVGMLKMHTKSINPC